MIAIRRIAFALVLLAVSALGQFETAVVLGTVRDATQSVVPGARITLLNLETGIQAVASADDNGNYLFPNVKVGRYMVLYPAELRAHTSFRR